jgi:UDP-N-acetylglucosamine/UDP-N-acetylgalactosamine diphosphorylase
VSAQAARLRAAGQDELADALEGLEGEGRARLEAQVAELDLDLVAELAARHAGGDEEAAPAAPEIAPADVIRLPADDVGRAGRAAAAEAGEDLLREGGVAAVLLAGGQGTRLGFDGPKGAFPFAPITGRTLFAHHAAKIAALRRRYGAEVPWYVLTSPQNDAETRRIFADAGFHGLAPDSVRFVEQGTMPAVDRATGAILREAPDRLALSPDGHGGLLAALRRHGVLDELTERGVRMLTTFQVDNPALRVARPELLGHHALADAEVSSLAVRKVDPAEKMGVFARFLSGEHAGRTGIVEYSDLPEEVAARRESDGSLTFWAGSIAVHCIEVAFVARLTGGGPSLPFHRALKKVPHVDARGRPVDPEEPNAVKFETFLFDALPFAERTVVLETAREDDFAPIKNREGADSPESARRLLNRLYARWLEAAGVEVPRDADGEPPDLEIDPGLALGPEDLAGADPGELTVRGPTALPLAR